MRRGANIASICMLLFAVSCKSSYTASETRQGVLDDEIGDLSRMISVLPDWPSNRHMTGNEWAQYAKVAIQVQTAGEEEVRAALAPNGDRMPWQEGATRMLLLRMVFEVPIDATPANAPQGIKACGGIPALPASPHERGLGEPVWWREGQRPVLTAFQASAGGATGPHGPYYYPLSEYDYFRKMFPFRDRSQLIELNAQ